MYFIHFFPQIMASERSWTATPNTKDLQEILHELQGGKIKPNEVCPVLTEAITRVETFIHSADEFEVDIKQLAMIVDCMKYLIPSLYNEQEVLQQKVEKAENMLEDERKEWKKLETELRKRIEALEGSKDKILLGQMAAKVDRELLKKIVEGTTMSTEYLTVGRIDKNLKDGNSDIFKSDKEKAVVKQNWTVLKSQMNISWQDIYALKDFKHTRNYVAHPDLTLEEAHELIQEASGMSENQKSFGYKFLEILRKLSIDRIGTAHI